MASIRELIDIFLHSEREREREAGRKREKKRERKKKEGEREREEEKGEKENWILHEKKYNFHSRIFPIKNIFIQKYS